MKATGMVRKIDPLGRLVLPVEIRRVFDFETGSPIEIFTDDNKIILQKFERNCVFCGSKGHIKEFKDKYICDKCLKNISKIKE